MLSSLSWQERNLRAIICNCRYSASFSINANTNSYVNANTDSHHINGNTNSHKNANTDSHIYANTNPDIDKKNTDFHKNGNANSKTRTNANVTQIKMQALISQQSSTHTTDNK